jgi:hypothetical protein
LLDLVSGHGKQRNIEGRGWLLKKPRATSRELPG